MLLKHKIPIGTLCKVMNSVSNPQFNGLRVVVVEHCPVLSEERGAPVYVVRVTQPSPLRTAVEACLRPIYDGGVATSWDQCAWFPTDVKAKQKGGAT